VQETLQPPLGHWIEQVLLPPHETVAAVPRVRLHWLPPVQVVVLEAPVVKLHWLCPSQVVVHEFPQLAWQTFFDVQL
jgi:hypothetical protein